MKRIVATTSILLALSACHRPERIQAVTSQDGSLTCAQIQQEQRRAQMAKQSARNHDKFELRYILVVPAIVSMYNFDKAEKAADQRIDVLNKLYAAKQCAYQNQMMSSQPYPGMQPSSPYGTSQQPNMMQGMQASPYGMPMTIQPPASASPTVPPRPGTPQVNPLFPGVQPNPSPIGGQAVPAIPPYPSPFQSQDSMFDNSMPAGAPGPGM